MDIVKIAIFLLCFGLVALIFEIFYFRRKRKQPPVAPQAGDKTKRFKKKHLIIGGIIFILLLLPISLYLASKPAIFENEAADSPTSQTSSATITCDQIDVVKNTTDTVSFVGYCATGDQSSIQKIRFTLTTAGGAPVTTEFLAFAAPQKDTAEKHYFKATYPNIKLSKGGSYSVQVWAISDQLGVSKDPFTKTFSLAAGTITPTPTPIATPTLVPTSAQTRVNNPPACTSLSAIPLTGPAPLTVSLTGTGGDTDGQVTAFEFTFGDSAKQTVNKNVGAQGSVSTSHAYQTAGSYTASLRVRDNSGNFSPAAALCSVSIAVTQSSATASANLKAQPERTVTPTAAPVTLPQAGLELPMIIFIGAGLLVLTFGLLLAF